MVTTSKARKIIGKNGQGISNKELERLIKEMYLFAGIVADSVSLNVSNKQLGVIDSPALEVNNESK